MKSDSDRENPKNSRSALLPMWLAAPRRYNNIEVELEPQRAVSYCSRCFHLPYLARTGSRHWMGGCEASLGMIAIISKNRPTKM